MNIEIANRLVELRKKNNLSQEQLAEKIGVSRQAVSKWERSEASPDTDNLIMLARLYNVSLDDLLKTEDEIPKYEDKPQDGEEQPDIENENGGFDNENSYDSSHSENSENNNSYQEYSDGKEKVNIGPDGIHVEDNDSYVHVGWDGIHVNEKYGDNVHIDRNGIFVNGEQKHWGSCGDGHVCRSHHRNDKQYMSGKLMLLTSVPFAILVFAAYIFTGFYFNDWSKNWLLLFTIPLFDGIVSCIAKKRVNKFPYPLACITGYLCAGIFTGLWHPMWIMLLTIPLFEGLISAVKHRSMARFPYPILALVVFLTIGCVYGIWHPTWVIFLTIVFYYWLAACLKHIKKDKANGVEEFKTDGE